MNIHRTDFREQLGTWNVEQIVYADEAGMDSLYDYAYGYSPKGERLYALKSGRRCGRVNMIAALCNQQLLAPFTIVGARKSNSVRDMVANLLDTGLAARAETGD